MKGQRGPVMAGQKAASPYSGMAVVYDALIEDVDYGAWAHSWHQQYKAYREGASLPSPGGAGVLEIGAGTGNMTEQLLDLRLRVTALEPSEAMLSVLQEKLFDRMGSLRVFNGYLKDFKTKERFDAIVGFLDVLNYISPTDLEGFFSQVATLLLPGGYATFDVSTPYKLENILGHHTFAENHDEFAFIWENSFQAKGQYLDFEFALFSENDSGLFERTVEAHRQYAHRVKSIVEAAAVNGLSLMGHYGDHYTPVSDQASRWHFWFKKDI